jgi:hypothetical protein
MNPTILAVCVCLVAVVGAVWAWNSLPRRERLKRFESRPDLSVEQIYNDFFARENLPAELVSELWKEVAESLRLPPGRLRPTDRFDQELAAPKGWEHDDEILEVQWAAERRLKQCRTQADLSQIKTVGDYVEFFCKLAAKTQQALHHEANPLPLSRTNGE